jgi:phosphoglycerate kinase
MQSFQKLPPLKGSKVLIRVDYNVPMKGNRIIDARRIEASYKTIDAVLKKGGTPILIAHLGDGSMSLRPIATFLSKKYKTVFVTNDLLDAQTETIITAVPKHTVILLENIRRYKEEEENNAAFAKRLALLGSYYINEAFSVSHRKHASLVRLPKLLPAYAGAQLIEEVKQLSGALTTPKHPFVFILGGAKFKTKIPLIKRFIDTADSIVITGALLNNFYKAAGFEVGDSVVEAGFDTPIKKVLSNPKLLLPIDVVVVRNSKKIAVSIQEVQKDDIIVDIGPRSVSLITDRLQKAKMVVWNGPTGWYEKGFTKASTDLAKVLIAGKAKAIIGGGDTSAVIEKTMKSTTTNKNIFISTGGGATIEYLSSGTLPGIAALG